MAVLGIFCSHAPSPSGHGEIHETPRPCLFCLGNAVSSCTSLACRSLHTMSNRLCLGKNKNEDLIGEQMRNAPSVPSPFAGSPQYW